MKTISHLLSLCILLVFVSAYGQEPNFNMIGYATVDGEGYSTTTGGAGGDTITIETLADLQAYAKDREKNTTPEVLLLKGYFEASPTTVVTFKHGANLSILGTDEGAELNGVGIRIWDYKNVIIRNLKIHEIFYPDDALSVEECQHVWVDHNELHSKIGAGIGVDTYDGLLDIKKGSRYVTVSWNYLHDHMKCMLIGHTDNSTQGEEDKEMRITIHHNIFERTNGRNPSLRWGAAHIFNNYYSDIDDYGIALRQGAHGLIENNWFNDVKTCISTNKFDGEGKACLSGNEYTGTASKSNNSITQTDCEFWNDLPYKYELDSTAELETLLRENAGTGIIDIFASFVDTTNTDEVNLISRTELKCYPNPLAEALNVEFYANEEAWTTIALINLSGKVVLQQNTLTISGLNRIQLNTERLEKGMYLVTLKGSGFRKLIVKN